MHIIILADAIDNQNAGVHHYLKNLIDNLLKFDKQNTYSFIHSRKNPYFRGKKSHIIPQHNYPGSETIRRFHKIPKLIRRINPDAVWQPCHIGPFRIPPHIKRIVTIHDLTPLLFPKFHTSRGKIIHRLLLGRTLKNADLILTPSETTKRDIINKYDPLAKIAVTPLGVNPVKKSPRGELSPYFLYLGTIEPRKNLELLIDTFLEANLPQNLILAGAKGWKNSAIIKKANHPRIKILTNISEQEKSQLYSNADAFIYPSIYEGFGLPPLEAIAHGLPVICSTGGSLKEIYSGHAFTFNPTDKARLISHMKNYKKIPRSSLHKKLTWENTAKETIKVLK